MSSGQTVRVAIQGERGAFSHQAALEVLAGSWRDGYACLLVDIARFMRPRLRARTLGGDAPDAGFRGRGAGAAAGAGSLPVLGPGQPEHPSTRVRERLVRFLEQQTGQYVGDDLGEWRHWFWRLSYEPHP